MMKPWQILSSVMVKPFYTENAGVFILVFTMMFVIVGSTHGAGLYAYHYSLATAILQHYGLLLLVLAVWYMYVRKYVAFISAIIHRPEYTFLQVLNSAPKSARFVYLFFIHLALLLPVWLYAFFIVSVGLKQQLYIPLCIIISFLLLMNLLYAALHVRKLDAINIRQKQSGISKGLNNIFSNSYLAVLLQFVMRSQLVLWLVLKLSGCGLLYLIARNNIGDYYDTGLPFLFFSLVILAHSIPVYKIRMFEEEQLLFYRSLPISVLKRWGVYALLYWMLLLPEIITCLSLAPVHLHWTDAIHFALYAYTLVLLINSISFFQHFSRKEFMAIMLLLFGVQCFFILIGGYAVLWGCAGTGAVWLFFKGYYNYEQLTEE